MFEGLPGWKPGERPLGFEGVPGRQSSLTQHTTITVTGGGDAAATAQRVAELQQRVNADLVRNLQRALA